MTDLNATVDEAELAHFAAAAHTWWDPNGIARWMHRYNPLRVRYIREIASRHFERDIKDVDCLRGLRLLDMGCGPGLLSEPMAELGAAVVGADPIASNIDVARAHAKQKALTIEHRCATAEALASLGERFDLVLVMDVVEHVADSDLFMQKCAEMVSPGGLAIFSTINRSVKSFLQAIVCGEYIFGFLPRGSHRWRRFLTPQEIRTAMQRNGLRVLETTGVGVNLLSWKMQLVKNTGVTYFLVAERPR